MTREDARNAINARPLSDFISLQLSRKKGKNAYACPICGSGTGTHGTSAFSISRDNRVICFANSCFTDKGEDTLGALRRIWQCSETDAIKRAGYIIDGDAAPIRQEHIKHHEHQPEPVAEYSSLYREWHEALKASPEALAYLHGRGITDESIDRFNLGFCAAWKHTKAGAKVPPTKRIIIPRTATTYTARRIDPPANEFEAQYTKQVQGRQKDLFNLSALDGAETPFICEGELDCISLIQAGASSVVGIGTIVNAGLILEEAKKHPEAVYILAFDNDPDKEDGSNPGKDAQRNLAEKMKAAGLAVVSVNPAVIYGEAKDANEAFTKDPERLAKVVSYLEEQAQEAKRSKDEARAEELRKRTGEGMLEDFLLQVTTKRDFEPIPTGIPDIDRAIQGGFTRKTLVMLGAPPAMGKTALAQWIFENMAAAGQDVLYINLEMDRAQLLARSLSRLAWKYNREDLNALDVLRGYAWTDTQRNVITEAANRYKTTIAPHFVYNPDNVTNHIDSILKAMEEETARIKAQGKPAPLICIDYLQLIDSGERDAIEGMKQTIFKLKTFARNNDTVVFVILANNRASNKSGIVEMESGRDTSTIEYSGDLMLGLSFTAIEDRRTYTYTDKDGKEKTKVYDLETIRRLKKDAYEAGTDVPAVCNEVSLKVLKNRFGEAERRANLIFDGKHNTFNLSEYRYRAEDFFTGFKQYSGASPFDD